MFEIQCPHCQASNMLSLIDRAYYGPFRCWKCRQACLMEVKNGQLSYCRPVSEQEMEKHLKSKS